MRAPTARRLGWIHSAGFAVLFFAQAAHAQSPLDVTHALQAAFDAGDGERALALFADDAVVINSRGRRIQGKDSLTSYVRGTAGARLQITPGTEREAGARAWWYNSETSPAYTRIGVTARLGHMAEVRAGRITLFVTWFEPASAAELRQACQTPDKAEVTIFGQPCAQFAAQATAFTETALNDYADK